MRTEGEAPSAPPTGVRVDALSPTSLSVMWDSPPSHTHHGDLLGYNVGVRRHEYVTHKYTHTYRKANRQTNRQICIQEDRLIKTNLYT